MKTLHRIGGLTFTDNRLAIEIDGEEKQYDLRSVSDALANASEPERMTYEISPSGYGIYWPLIDEDISVDGLLGVVHRPALEAAEM
ncbi:MAG: DUF2442 domain-containing protein [Candidatus Electrothrix sp. AR3]|nr:DUF2442 domain-containing protein [Candidatus Electrothrix sp. AR3]